MRTSSPHRLTASILAFALATSFVPAFAAPRTATLDGTVLAGEATTPLAGAVVIVTDASGTRIASIPTGRDGTFAIAAIPAGRVTLAVRTDGETYEVATPVQLAPGETRGVQVALKARSGKKRAGAATVPAEGTGTGAMIAVLVGFVAAGAAAIHRNNETKVPASPSSPDK
jgi:Carboxypeptidase regulatory-like domain